MLREDEERFPTNIVGTSTVAIKIFPFAGKPFCNRSPV